MKIGLLGCGTVGSGVLHICDHPQTKAMQQLQVKRILMKEGVELWDSRMTTDFNDILSDDEIDCVVEVIGGTTTAKEYILKALNAKKNVVTANKAVIALYFKEFMETAQQNNVQFRIEASVGGGIPWIENCIRAKRIDEISSISGIFNGTTNFILDTLTHQQVDFDEVLKEAQRLGYAEADPSADIDGFDIQNKCSISACIAYNCFNDVNQIDTFGIRTITQTDIQYFKNKHKVCKLLAVSNNYGDFISAYVQPTFISTHSLTANVPSNFNLVSLRGHTVHDLKFYGQGAGQFATAHAVLQDCLDIAFHQAELNPMIFNDEKQIDNTKEMCTYYIRIKKDVSCLDEIKAISLSYENSEQDCLFMTHQISVHEMHQYAKKWQLEDHTMFFACVM